MGNPFLGQTPQSLTEHFEPRSAKDWRQFLFGNNKVSCNWVATAILLFSMRTSIARNIHSRCRILVRHQADLEAQSCFCLPLLLPHCGMRTRSHPRASNQYESLM